MRFGGETYSPEHDKLRLTTLMHRVHELMLDGNWRTLSTIAKECRGSEASVSARLRDLRKAKFQDRYPCGDVERRRKDGGLYEYRVLPKGEEMQMELRL